MSRDVEEFRCWKCKTLFYLEKEKWHELKRKRMKVFCPECRTLVFKGGSHEARA